jgi:hypothetical protein
MAVREFVYIVQEASYMVPVTTPVVGTSAFYLRLDGGNAFTMRPKPLTVKVPRGGGQSTQAYTVSGKTEVKGTLKTIFYASQASFLLGWASTPLNVGLTAPWTYAGTAGDLASCTIYHGIARSDGTVKRRAYLGCKITDWTLDQSSDNQQGSLSLGIQASTPQGNTFDSSIDPDATIAPAPLDSQYPIDPYLFTHTKGHLTIGSARTQYDSLSIKSTNKLDPRWFENRFLSVIPFFGRATTIESSLYYKPTPDDRTSYENLTAATASIKWDNGTHSALFTLDANNVFSAVDDDLGLDTVYLQKGTIENQWDPAASNDFTWAFT